MTDSPTLVKPFDFTQFAQQVMAAPVSNLVPIPTEATPVNQLSEQIEPQTSSQAISTTQSTDAVQSDLVHHSGDAQAHKAPLESTLITVYNSGMLHFVFFFTYQILWNKQED